MIYNKMNIKRKPGYILSLHGQVVRRQSCKLKIPSSTLGEGFFLALAQLAERWTVIV